MNVSTYSDIKRFILSGILPEKFTSTKGNFIKQSQNYTVNAKGTLLRAGKIVVRDCEIEKAKIFQCMHRI